MPDVGESKRDHDAGNMPICAGSNVSANVRLTKLILIKALRYTRSKLILPILIGKTLFHLEDLL